MKNKTVCIGLLFVTLLSYPLPAASPDMQFLTQLKNRLLTVQIEIHQLQKDLIEQGITIAKQKELQTSLEAKLNEQTGLIDSLSMLVDEQVKSYKQSLLKWKIGCVTLGVVSIAAGTAAVTMMLINK